MLAIKEMKFGWKKHQLLLDIDDFCIKEKEKVFLYGPSGYGKSSLLQIISGIIKPQSGIVSVLGKDITKMPSYKCDRFRGDNIGFIFQQFNLVPYLSAIQNVMLSCEFSFIRRQRLSNQEKTLLTVAKDILNRLDISEKIWNQRADTLSIGQQQRIAAARAFIGKPPLIIADEPTSSLDAERQDGFMKLLCQECEASGSSLLFVSHDKRLSSNFDKVISLPDINGVCS